MKSKSVKQNFLSTDVIPSMPQLLDNAKPLQTRTSESAVLPPYPETAYQWLVETLDGLIDFGQRHGHYGVINLAEADLQKALELAEQQENVDAKALVEAELQQLNQAALKQSNKKPRSGGQWKGKVKIAEDFDELPESFGAVFRGEDE